MKNINNIIEETTSKINLSLYSLRHIDYLQETEDKGIQPLVFGVH